MFCTNCGTKAVEGSAHCTNCGKPVEGVGAAASIMTNVAVSAYSALDHNFKKSLFLGAGCIFASILTILLPGPSFIFMLVLLPATIVLGVLALNAGRDLTNKAGYYLGMIGLIAGCVMFYAMIAAYAVRSAAYSMAGEAARSLF
jgi:hypothetical protein